MQYLGFGSSPTRGDVLFSKQSRGVIGNHCAIWWYQRPISRFHRTAECRLSSSTVTGLADHGLAYGGVLHCCWPCMLHPWSCPQCIMQYLWTISRRATHAKSAITIDVAQWTEPWNKCKHYNMIIMCIYRTIHIVYHSAYQSIYVFFCDHSILLWSMLPPPRRPQTWIICLTIRPSFPWHPSMGMWARSAWRTTWHVNSPFGRWKQSSNFGNCNLHTRCFLNTTETIIPTSSTKKHTQARHHNIPQHTTKKGHKSKPKYSLLHPTPSFMDKTATLQASSAGSQSIALPRVAWRSFGVGIPLDRLL